MQALSPKIRGLYTFPNDFSSIPEGALSQADNIVIDRDNIAEPRRGFTYLASQAGRADFLAASDRAQKIFFYDGTEIIHTKDTNSDYRLQYFSSTDGWHDITTSAVAKTVNTGVGGGFDETDDHITCAGHGFTTGMRVTLSINGGSLPSGLAAGTYYIIVYNASIFLLATSYANALAGTAVNFTTKGSNGQVATFTPTAVIDPPSSTIKMRSAQAKQNLYLTTKEGVVRVEDATLPPVPIGVPQALDMYNTTASDLSATTTWLPTASKVAYRIVYGYKDSHGSIYLGAPSGRGYITNASGSDKSTVVHLLLPLGLTTSHFIQLYRSEYVASTAEPSDELRLVYESYLTTSNVNTGAMSINDVVPETMRRGALLYTNDSQEGAALANVKPPNAKDITMFRDFMFYADLTEQQTYLLTLKTCVGLTAGDRVTIGATTYYANEPLGTGRPGFGVSSTGNDAVDVPITARELVLAINTYQGLYYATYASVPNDLPGKILIRSYATNAPVFSLTSDRGSCFIPPLPTVGTTESSTAEVTPNGLACSKELEPESVPLKYRWPAGSKDAHILRIIGLRDSLFILKGEGVYRLYGTDPSNFQVTLLDGTANIIAPDSAVVLNNQIFAFTTQGVVSISETGVTIMSRPIELDLLKLIQTCGTVLQTESFGVNYESQRSYYLWLPSVSTDTHPTQYYRYNTITNNWTRGTLAKLCGGVSPVDDRLYLGLVSKRFLYVENKNQTAWDYSDYFETETISGVSDVTVTITDASSLEAGQVIYQSDTLWGEIATIVDSTHVTTKYPVAFTNGTAQILGPIDVAIKWAPSTFSNPGISKQVRELAMLFRTDFYGEGTVSFETDLSPQVEYETVAGSMAAPWGLFPWGGGPWGGVLGRRPPVRIMVPRIHQRASLIIVGFEHAVCFSPWALQGISFVGNNLSEKLGFDGGAAT